MRLHFAAGAWLEAHRSAAKYRPHRDLHVLWMWVVVEALVLLDRQVHMYGMID